MYGNFALLYCGLAVLYGFIGGIDLSGKDMWSKEYELPERALSLDPSLAEAHVSLDLALASAFRNQ